MKKFRRTKAVAQGSVVALAVAALVFGLATLIFPKHSPKLLLASNSGSGFSITSTISSSSTAQIPANLVPGPQFYLWYTAHNPLNVPITVTSMSITAVNPPAGCPASNLNYSGTAFSGSLLVPAASTTAVAEPISLATNSPNTCENVSFGLTYAGTATYTEVYATSTVLVSSQNPSSVDQQVTYTATVTATATSGQDPVPNSPTGTVTFKDGSTAICTGVAVMSTGTTTAMVTCPQTYTSTSGSPHSITAVYSNTDGNFSGSTSSPLSQVVQSSLNATTTALTASPSPTTVGSSVTLSATVTKSSGSGTPSGTVTFYSGTPTGTRTQLGTGTLNSSAKASFSTSTLPAGTDSLYAVYGGNTSFATSTSPVISEMVNLNATTTALTAAPNPSGMSASVTLTATVSKSSGSGTPIGTVSFYLGTPTGTHSLLGTGTLNSSAKATFGTSSLPLGANSLYAAYGGDSDYFSTSTSPVMSEVVNLNATTTALSSSPNPSGRGGAVTLTGKVSKSSGSATPTGTVSFYSGTPSGTHSLLGTGTLNTSVQASFMTSSLPVGIDSLYAVYNGDGDFSSGTSSVIAQVVIAPPASCTGTYANTFIGVPGSPFIDGTNGNDFIYAFGGSYWANGFGGNDCLDAGDGNNVLTDGDGSDVVLVGNGNNVISVGNGTDKVVVGDGSNGIEAGNGADSVTIGNGSRNGVLLGNGTDTVTVGSGSYNDITLGSGTDTATVQGGSHDDIDGGNGNETIYLGSGTYNSYDGAAHRTNICHLPTPPPSWHGTAASYYHDTITNCTVVTP